MPPCAVQAPAAQRITRTRERCVAEGESPSRSPSRGSRPRPPPSQCGGLYRCSREGLRRLPRGSRAGPRSPRPAAPPARRPPPAARGGARSRAPAPPGAGPPRRAPPGRRCSGAARSWRTPPRWSKPTGCRSCPPPPAASSGGSPGREAPSAATPGPRAPSRPRRAPRADSSTGCQAPPISPLPPPASSRTAWPSPCPWRPRARRGPWAAGERPVGRPRHSPSSRATRASSCRPRRGGRRGG
mmetsp:Transcript_21062/g.59580  ORF Transcript_21062/g.59580 Transcript_21062/m.59580 type:complete len:242 (+) Transcript_21062:145-870(+)